MTNSAIDDLLREILHSNRSLSALLHQALVVSSGVDSQDFRAWVEQELDGYQVPLGDLPSYRVVPCRLFGANSSDGPWTPIDVDSNFSFMLKFPVNRGIPNLEEVLRNMSITAGIQHPLPAELANSLHPMIGLSYFVHRCGKAELAGVVPAVRSELVRRTLKLQAENGGRTPSNSQKNDLAPSLTTTYVINMHGQSVAHIQQGNATAYQTAETMDLAEIRSLVEQLRSILDHLGLSDSDRGELAAELDTLQVQASSPKPKPVVIKEAGKTVRNILEGITGNGLSNVLLPQLPALIDRFHRFVSGIGA